MHPIKEHVLIGDLHTAALVAKGNIVWMCLPHFDSPSVFANILDERGGSFSLIAEDHDVETQYEGYVPIAQTTVSGDSEYTVRDFMVPRPSTKKENHLLVRQIVAKTDCNVTFRFNPRPGYGEETNVTKQEGTLTFNLDESTVHLHLPANSATRKDTEGWIVEIALSAGEEKELILEDRRDGPCSREDLETITTEFWDSWISKGIYWGRYRSELIRSAVTLKLLQFYPSGALIAAPTTSLPEAIGAGRNWDYRYTWIRDATFTLYAFYVLGYTEELVKFTQFIEDIISRDQNTQLSLMYTINGGNVPAERELAFSGYMNSGPVRVGNDAADQFQLDTYGSLIDMYYFLSRRDLDITQGGRELIIELADIIERRWKEKDNSIWEVRVGRQHYTYSKVMAWVGIDRAAKLCDMLGIGDEKKNRWTSLANEIKDWIWENCYDEKIGSFVQYPGTDAQDATNLLFVLLQFLDRHDERTEQIIRNTCKALSRGPHMYRYRNEDGLEGEEGTFVLCTFWQIAAMAAIERVDEAQKLFDEFRNCLEYSRLMPEEIDPNQCDYLGNYPQAFSHMGLVLAAHYLERYGK